MQYILNQPQTPLQLINWLKLHHVERMYQLTPFYKSVTKYTSPLCVKTSKSLYHHVAMVETALHSANTLEELPPDAIMFFPNYATLHAAFTIAKEGWTIDQAVEYIGTAADNYSTFFQYLHPEDRLRLPKVDDILYPYYHWQPVRHVFDGYSVTSGHFPYLGNRPIEQYHTHSKSSTATVLRAKAKQIELFVAELQAEAKHLQLNIPELDGDDEDEDL